MARISHTQEASTSSNPTKRYLEYKSVKKEFSYYDKDLGEEVNVPLPLKFVFIQHYHTVKGWHDASNSGIYANEVFFIGSEPMSVKSFKGGKIAEGIYTDIKAQVLSAGGKYHKSIYVMLEDGTLANISLKGSSVKEWSDFMEENKNNVDNNWVEILVATDEKKGSIKYSVPKFTLGDSLTKKESSDADSCAFELKEYLDSKTTKEEEVPLELGI